MAHVFEIALVEVVPLLCQEEVYQVIVAFQVLSADKQEPLHLLTLLVKHGVHGVLVKAVYKFYKVILQECKLFSDRNLQGIEGLLDKHLFAVLRCKSKYVDDHAPARLDKGSLRATNICDAHDDVLFDFSSGCQVVKHYLLEGFQEIFLEVETSELFLD